MTLKLYRRHRSACEGHHPEDSRTGEFEEGRRGWKRCACMIHASGTLGRKFGRKQTGVTEWDQAKAIADEWQKAKSWDGEVSPPAPLPDPVAPHRITIDHGVKAFLDELKESVAFGTQKKYRLLLEKLKA